MNIPAKDFYEDIKQLSDTELRELKRKLARNSIFRLLSFLLIFPSVFGLVKASVLLGIACALFFLVMFLMLVKKHLKLQKRRSYVMYRNAISKNERSALDHDFSAFSDGVPFVDHRHDYSYDLDIFGEGSIFQMINRTVTSEGEQMLAHSFIHEPESVSSINAVQEGVKELSAMPEWMLHFRATGSNAEIIPEDKTKLKQWIETRSIVGGKPFLRILVYILPIVLFFTLGLTIYDASNLGLFVICYFLNMFVIGFNFKTINKEHAEVSGLLKMLLKYKALLHVIESEDYTSPKLVALKGKLGKHGLRSGVLLHHLTKHVGALDQRLNLLVAILLEPFLLWDYHCLLRIDKWKMAYGELLPDWLEQVARMDKLVSMATHSYNNPGYVFPEFSDATVFEGEELGHPLIPEKVRVCNGFSLARKGNYVIITGANMAGKSTFLRTVGVNMVMAKAGLPVCAQKLVLNPMKLYTSMRTSDSLTENESYFYAELLRLKNMLDKLEAGEELFIILDEILKGTNSVDKQKGSMMALEKILRLNGTGIIATHDLALTEIERDHPDKVKNKCFEIEIDNAQIHFDYKLYNGVTQKMNAMLLMEQMGIIN